MSVKFTRTERGYLVERDGVAVGEVERGTRSTDSRIAGTRLRRSGKGAPAWAALVPDEEAERVEGDPVARRRLQGTFDHGWRLEPWRGQKWDTRAEAVYALLDWHDHPEKREASS